MIRIASRTTCHPTSEANLRTLRVPRATQRAPDTSTGVQKRGQGEGAWRAQDGKGKAPQETQKPGGKKSAIVVRRNTEKSSPQSVEEVGVIIPKEKATTESQMTTAQPYVAQVRFLPAPRRHRSTRSCPIPTLRKKTRRVQKHHNLPANATMRPTNGKKKGRIGCHR